MIGIAVCLVSLYILIIISAYFLQDKLIFFPQKLPGGYIYNLSPSDKEVFIKTKDGETINGILFKKAGNRNVFLYFHGNAGALDGWQDVGHELQSLNCDILIIDNRGYGKSTGEISENGFYQDADAAYNYLLANGYSADNIIPYGRSLGTSVAVNLASSRHVKALVLETPYINITKLANEKFPYLFPSLFLKYNFNNYDKCSKLDIPVLLLHGDADELIPCEHSRELYNAIKTDKKKLVIIKGGGHNDLGTYPEHNSAIAEFLSTL